MGSTSKRGGFLLPAGIAFVGFTTQFGGGFASGAQIYQYFINYGFWGLLMRFWHSLFFRFSIGTVCVMPIDTSYMTTAVFQKNFTENSALFFQTCTSSYILL